MKKANLSAGKKGPELIVLNLARSEVSEVKISRVIRGGELHASCLVLNTRDSEIMLRTALGDSCLLRSALARKLKFALQVVAWGHQPANSELSDKPTPTSLGAPQPRMESPLSSRLTDRELQVLRLLSSGRSSKEIGGVLNISTRTVEAHRANIMRKLNVHSATELLYLTSASDFLEA
jgi:DNA-binding NarL/FixJ family response regulator